MKLGFHKFKSLSAKSGMFDFLPSSFMEFSSCFFLSFNLRFHNQCIDAICFDFSGRLDIERGNIVANNTISVSQEYKAAIRTSSYEEMFSRVQIQLTRTSSNPLYSSSQANICILHLSETLLEPRAETLDSMIKTLHLHHLIVDFFEASSQACNVCELLLRNIHRTRTNYCWIKRAFELSLLMNPDSNTRYCEEIRVELRTFVSLRNPLGFLSSVQFHDMHEDHVGLLHRIVKKRKEISRKMKILRICKKAGGCCLVASCCALGVLTLVIAAHTIVGIAAAPGILLSCLGLGLSKNPTEEKGALFKGRHCDVRNDEKLKMQLDTAAKWLFVLVNDMDTVSSLVEKLYYEMEHSRARIDLGLKNEVMLMEVVKELEEEKMCFMEQLEELEEHIYLCLVTINKSRKSFLDETASGHRHGGDDD